MPIWMRAAGKWGGILVVIALLITLLKQLIAFLAFITGVFKLIVLLVFVALVVGIGFMLLKSWNESRRTQG